MTPRTPPRLPRRLALAASLALLAPARAARADEFQPAPAASVPGYFASVMPCTIVRDGRAQVECKGRLLEGKSLRELSILRNTIYARYGWDGYRKPWLRAYFHSQPWFKPNPRFSYKQLADADRKNAHLVAVREQSLTSDDLEQMKDAVLARRGKVWGDVPEWTLANGRKVRSCKEPAAREPGQDPTIRPEASKDCRAAKLPGYRANPAFTEASLTADDKIELGLISRAMGQFSLDDETRGKHEESLDRVLKPEELRQLSLRDLRLLRNTIYARRGRAFKSPILQDHFAGMSWYKVDPAYSDKVLSRNDTRNIALIKSVENEFGGPLSDEDWLTEPATDGA